MDVLLEQRQSAPSKSSIIRWALSISSFPLLSNYLMWKHRNIIVPGSLREAWYEQEGFWRVHHQAQQPVRIRHPHCRSQGILIYLYSFDYSCPYQWVPPNESIHVDKPSNLPFPRCETFPRRQLISPWVTSLLNQWLSHGRRPLTMEELRSRDIS